MIIEHFIVGPLQMRCSVVTNPSDGATIIIDGGEEADRIIEWIVSRDGVGPDATIGAEMDQSVDRVVHALINTHAHFDHTGAIPHLKEHFDVPWLLHGSDHELQRLAQVSGRMYGIHLPSPAIPDGTFEHGDVLIYGGMRFDVLHAPGHTTGGVCFLLHMDEGPCHLFVGDTLFAGSVGRTDIPMSGGDPETLERSIRTVLWPLDDDTVVHPGHGPLTTIGHERRTNPFVGEHATGLGRGRYH